MVSFFFFFPTREIPTLDLLEDGVVELRKGLRVWLCGWVAMVDTKPQTTGKGVTDKP